VSSVGQQQQQTTSSTWGEGSLVNYLRDRGFAPKEILDSGLAIQTKRGKQHVLEQQNQMTNDENNVTATATSINSNNGTAVINIEYSTLMDRFRGRLVVPIFDAAGDHVLGFGGRILETISSGSDFKAAKYLNSPESIVFQKKNILFGQHMAEKCSTMNRGKSSLKDITSGPKSLIVVEGYMDAISLWQAGVKETVASMGTALTLQQLSVAAKTARKLGGRIVLCMDNDDAGVAAVDRLCTGQTPILYSATEETSIEIYVASLPGTVKDPADYLEEHKGSENLDDKFRTEVIQNAAEWTEWYTNRILSSFNSSASNGEDNSFNHIFDQLASFLSKFEDVEEKFEKASMMSRKLAPLFTVSNDSGGDRKSDETTRARLESDLLQKASSLARSNSIGSIGIYRNLELSEDSVGGLSTEISLPKSLELTQDLSSAESPWIKSDGRSPEKISSSSTPDINLTDDRDPPVKVFQRRTRDRIKRPTKNQNSQKSMTKHIRGVRSDTLNDDWLGFSKDKVRQGGKFFIFSSDIIVSDIDISYCIRAMANRATFDMSSQWKVQG
jgi:DNA primase catalytic core